MIKTNIEKKMFLFFLFSLFNGSENLFWYLKFLIFIILSSYISTLNIIFIRFQALDIDI